MTMYYGMNSATGKAITDTEHLRLSVKDILIAPQGSALPVGNMVCCCPR
jgi:hypothetical protein